MEQEKQTSSFDSSHVDGEDDDRGERNREEVDQRERRADHREEEEQRLALDAVADVAARQRQHEVDDRADRAQDRDRRLGRLGPVPAYKKDTQRRSMNDYSRQR